MDEKRLTGEQMLRAWLNLSSTVWNRRVVSTDLPPQSCVKKQAFLKAR